MIFSSSVVSGRGASGSSAQSGASCVRGITAPGASAAAAGASGSGFNVSTPGTTSYASAAAYPPRSSANTRITPGAFRLLATKIPQKLAPRAGQNSHNRGLNSSLTPVLGQNRSNPARGPATRLLSVRVARETARRSYIYLRTLLRRARAVRRHDRDP